MTDPYAVTCGECEAAAVDWDCVDCEESYCEKCKVAVHNRGRRREHKNFAKIYVCQNCSKVLATKQCLDCSKCYCTACCNKVHKGSTTKRRHKRIHDLTAAGALKPQDPETTNGFDIVVNTLAVNNSRYPQYVEDIENAQVSISQKLFIDTDAAVVGDEKLNEHIASWRRVNKVVQNATLFERGNSLLASRPDSIGELPAAMSKNVPKFEASADIDEHSFNVAMASVCLFRNNFNNLWVSAEHRGIGLYTLQFFDVATRTWRCVIVDDIMPCNVQNTPLFGVTEAPNEIWKMILMKGYAKHRGAIAHLHHAHPLRAWHDMSGGYVAVEQWDQTLTTSTPGFLDYLWWRMQSVSRFEFVVGLFQCSLVATGEKQKGRAVCDVEEDYEKVWIDPYQASVVVYTAELTSQHATDMGIRHEAVRNGIRLAKVRCFGDEGDKFEWAAASELWTKELREYFKYRVVDETLAYASMQDIAFNYNTVSVASNYPGAPKAFPISVRDGLQHQVAVLVREGTPNFSVSLSVFDMAKLAAPNAVPGKPIVRVFEVPQGAKTTPDKTHRRYFATVSSDGVLKLDGLAHVEDVSEVSYDGADIVLNVATPDANIAKAVWYVVAVDQAYASDNLKAVVHFDTIAVSEAKFLL